jgi:hypothetical protein
MDDRMAKLAQEHDRLWRERAKREPQLLDEVARALPTELTEELRTLLTRLVRGDRTSHENIKHWVQEEKKT